MINVGSIDVRQIEDYDDPFYPPDFSFGPMDMVKIAHASVHDHFCSPAEHQSKQPMPSMVSIAELPSHREIVKQCIACLLPLGPENFEHLSLEVRDRFTELWKAFKDDDGGTDISKDSTRQNPDTKLGAVICKSSTSFPGLSHYPPKAVWDTRHGMFCKYPLFFYSIKNLYAHLQESCDPTKSDPVYASLLEDFFCKDNPSICEIWLKYYEMEMELPFLFETSRPVSSFYAACFMGFSSVVERLWSSHSSLETFCEESMYGNGLEAALGEGHYEIYRYLTRVGAPSLLPKVDPAIVTAADCSQYGAVQRLLCADCPVTIDPMTKVEAFSNACRSSKVKVVRLFLDAGMDVTPEGPANRTILGLPAHAFDVLTLSINAGADINIRRRVPDASGQIIALYDAISCMARENTRALLAAGAEVSVRDAKGRSPLQLARDKANKFQAHKIHYVREASQQILEMLVRAGAQE